MFSKSATLRYQKPQLCKVLAIVHRQDRMEWASTHVPYVDRQWQTFIFSDEKWFNSDDLDGLSNCWQNLRRNKKVWFSCQMEATLMMIWEMFYWFENSESTVLLGRNDWTLRSIAILWNVFRFHSLDTLNNIIIFWSFERQCSRTHSWVDMRLVLFQFYTYHGLVCAFSWLKSNWKFMKIDSQRGAC